MKKIFMNFMCVCSVGFLGAMDTHSINTSASEIQKQEIIAYLKKCVEGDMSSQQALPGFLKLLGTTTLSKSDEACFHIEYQFAQALNDAPQTMKCKRKKIAALK